MADKLMTGHITRIRDFDAPELDVYARRTEAQLLNKDRPQDGLFIAESPKVILRALDAAYTPVSILTEERHIEGEGREVIARCGNIPVYTAPFDVLTRLTGFPLTRGMLCAMCRKPLPSPEEICRGARRIAVLENVMNPTNVGAIIRSAAALNMDGVLLSPGCSNPLYRRAVRVSMGTVFQIPWTILGDSMPEGSAGKEKTKKKHMDGWKEETWPGAGMALLKQLGFSCAAMALTDHSVGIDDEKVCAEEKLAIILGTEGEGLSRETIAACDYTVKIPMSHGVDSLNVAAASAVAFWQLGRGNEEQRKDR